MRSTFYFPSGAILKLSWRYGKSHDLHWWQGKATSEEKQFVEKHTTGGYGRYRILTTRIPKMETAFEEFWQKHLGN